MHNTINEVILTELTLDPLTGAAHWRVLDLHKLPMSITRHGSREDQETEDGTNNEAPHGDEKLCWR